MFLRFAFAIVLFCISIQVNAQIVDKTRLEYDEEKLNAKQRAMSVSPDMKVAAFAFDNGEVQFLDLGSSRIMHRHEFQVGTVHEVLFTADNNHVLLIEENRFRLIHWKTGKILMEETTQASIHNTVVSLKDDLFAIAVENKAKIYDVKTKTLLRSIEIKADILNMSFSPFRSHLLINPRLNMLKLRTYIFDYQTGVKVKEYKKQYVGVYDDHEDRIFIYQNRLMKMRRGGNTANVPVLSTMSSNDQTDNKIIYVVSSDKKEGKDVGFYTSLVRLKDKLVGAGGYRGFTVFGMTDEGGKVFTTRKTKRERSAGGLGFFREYISNPYARISDDKILVNAYGDNINQIYSASLNQIVGYIVTDAGGNYSIVSKDGRFDGSKELVGKLFWSSRKSNKRTSLESTFSRGFSPRLLPNLIGSEESIVEIDIEKDLLLMPAIEIVSFNDTPVKPNNPSSAYTTGQKKLNVKIKITENRSGIAEVKLFHNNKLVDNVENPSGDIIDFETNLSNSFGEANYLYAVATSKSGIDTDKKKLTINYKGGASQAARLFLVTVGIDKYKNSKYNLNYAVADADAFEKSISSGAGNLFDNVISLSIRNTDFSKSKVISALKQVSNQSNEQDLLVFYYAGHGVMSEGAERKSEFFLVPNDVTQLYGRDDMLYDRAISANELQELSKNINAQK
ncbi:MAG: caspase family protein, partial [Bacteroidota bacterium]